MLAIQVEDVKHSGRLVVYNVDLCVQCVRVLDCPPNLHVDPLLLLQDGLHC